MPSLPLFPLGTVLLPGAQLPLVIFEPRYIALLTDLLDAAQHAEPAFGVVAIRKGHEVGEDAATELYDIGCEAVIEQVTGEQPPFHVIARGRRRFRVTGRDDSAGTRYRTATVHWLDPVSHQASGAIGPDSAVVLAGLAADVRTVHAKLLRVLGASEATDRTAPVDELAYRIVERSALELPDRQSVLEAPTAADRLRTLRAILRRELALMTQVRAVPGQIEPGSFSPN